MKKKMWQHIFTAFFALILMITPAMPVRAAQAVVTAFATLAPEVENQTVNTGTKSGDLSLPGFLLIEKDGEFINIDVTWTSEPFYDEKIPGVYAFSAVLPDSYILAEGLEAPVIFVTVSEQLNNNVITGFAQLTPETAGQTVIKPSGTESVNLPEHFYAEIDGKYTLIPVGWASNPQFNGDTPGVYIFNPVLPSDYQLAAWTVLPVITVTVQEPKLNGIITAVRSLDLNITHQFVEQGSGLGAINLPEVLYAEIDGRYTAVPAEWVSSPRFDGGIPGDYIFNAVLSDYYILSAGVECPKITVTVGVPPQNRVITAFAQMNTETLEQTVEQGMDAEGMNLPDILYAEVEGRYVPIMVVWESNPTFNGGIPGIYVFTAALPNGYSLAAHVDYPVITVTVAVSQPYGIITAFAPIESDILRQTLKSGSGLEDIRLPLILQAEVGGRYEPVTASWESEPTFDGEIQGVYVFNAVLPESYLLETSVKSPTIVVEVLPPEPVLSMAGTGGPEDPFQVVSGQDLAELAVLVNSGGYVGSVKASEAWLVLTNDITVDGCGGPGGWIPVGDSASPFTGVFDGGGFSVSGLYIDSGDGPQGLFGVVGSGGVVKNVKIDGNVTGQDAVGGVAGRVAEGGSVINCGFSGSVTGNLYVGGVAGYVEGWLTECRSYGFVAGGWHVGGVAGAADGKLDSCFSMSEVTGGAEGQYTGGVAGYVGTGGSLLNCYARGTVTGGVNATGGVAGYVRGTLTNCYATGAVWGENNTGGVAGYLYGGQALGCAALNMSVAGTAGVGRVAGVIANNGGTEGSVGFTGTTDQNGQRFITDTSADINGRDVAKQSLNAAVFYTETLGFDENAWFAENDKLPVLRSDDGGLVDGQTNEMPSHLTVTVLNNEGFSGDGSENNPFEIWTAADLALLAKYVNGGERYYNIAYYQLMDDIDLADAGLSGTGWIPIGLADDVSLAFSGVFDGGGHRISGLYINEPAKAYQGLFGVISGGTVKNVVIKECRVTGGNTVGGLVGFVGDGGVISGCLVSGEISGNWYTGGLAGHLKTGEVTDSVSDCAVSGKWFVGGLIGLVDESFVRQSGSTGFVWGEGYVGGLAGYTDSSDISHSSGTGDVNGLWCVGGLSGVADASNFSGNNAEGDVTGDWYVGGFIGTVLDNCAVSGNDAPQAAVYGNNYVGGFIGYNRSEY